MICKFKEIRESKKQTQKECADIFGVTLRAWQSYEQGVSEPKYELLCRIADYYHCSVDYLLGRDAPAPMTLDDILAEDDTVTELERLFLGKYFAAKSTKMRHELCDMVLNAAREAGRGDIVDEIERNADRIVVLPLYDLRVSAGTGNIVGDTDAAPTDFFENEHTGLADFVVQISGDSMEPDFPDGAYLLVLSTEDIEPGDVGVFLNDGNVYVKRLELKRRRPVLHSINPAYKDIAAVDDFRVFGKVLGTVKKA